ncbi:MAG: cell division protein ZapA [Gemmatimonadota bacterium]|jgi:cell division protein ZapA|nr:MAG: cell division protein ZapA [Gemmatimonadota bacterium]
MSDNGEKGSDRKAVRVTIFGEDYLIRSELGQPYTERCARYVDAAIQEAHVRGHVAEPHKAAILAAMQITDRLFRAQAEAEELQQGVGERLTAMRRQIGAALGDGPQEVE